jgi:hypothetical protein
MCACKCAGACVCVHFHVFVRVRACVFLSVFMNFMYAYVYLSVYMHICFGCVRFSGQSMHISFLAIFWRQNKSLPFHVFCGVVDRFWISGMH